jgi:molybdenum cofactor cytidylyltransferase
MAEHRQPHATGVVVLAAGASSRLGSPKQLVTLGGRTLLRRAVETAVATGLGPVVVVLGAAADRCRPEVEGLDVAVVENAEWPSGMASSVRAGLAGVAAAAPDADAVLLTLCDQPFVTAELLSRLVSVRRETSASVVACEYAGALGVPALFGRELFGELAALEGESGARRVVARHAASARSVPFPEGAVDVDTPRDVERLRW